MVLYFKNQIIIKFNIKYFQPKLKGDDRGNTAHALLFGGIYVPLHTVFLSIVLKPAL